MADTGKQALLGEAEKLVISKREWDSHRIWGRYHNKK